MSEWRDLTELLVELDLTIEDLDCWASAPEAVAELQRREELRDQIHLAVLFHSVPRQLRRQLAELDAVGLLRPASIDLRD
jgi:hypothetical protein